jgi:predicted Zn-dependent protease
MTAPWPWSRRAVLRALATSATAPLTAPLLFGCGAAPVARDVMPAAAPWSFALVRARLRAEVDRLTPHHPGAAATVILRTVGRVAVDGDERTVAQQTTAAACFVIPGAGGQARESLTTNLDAASLRRAADLVAQGRMRAHAETAATAGRARRPMAYAARGVLDPEAAAPEQWLDPVAELFERSRKLGGSRTVYRAAYLTVVDDEILFVSAERDLRQRVARARGGVVFVVAAGAATHAAASERAGTIGLAALALGDDELTETAAGALALLTAQPAPPMTTDVVLDPGCAAMLAQECVAPGLAGTLWTQGGARAATMVGQPVAAPAVTLLDDPTGAELGSYGFDDEGTASSATRLIDAGVLRGPVTDRRSAAALGVPATGNGRRVSLTGPVVARSSHVALSPGAAADLVTQVEQGLLLQGAIAAGGNPRRWSASLRAARGREIKGGKLTGRLYAPVILVGEVPALLTAVRAVGQDARSFAAAGGEALDRSVSAPSILTQGQVRGG